MQIKPDIYNVGVGEDNAYLLMAEKTVLIDTVPKEYSDELIKNIENIISINKIDYLICNHTEQDKTGAVDKLLQINPEIRVIATVAGLRNLREMLNREFNGQVAKDNSVMCFGEMKLNFFVTPNINWPDSMVTYEENTKTLFSCDLFGSDDDDKNEYPEFVKNALERLESCEIDTICAGKGAVKNNAKEVIDKYRAACGESNNSGIVVLYSSRYGATEEMAATIWSALGDNDAVMINAYTEKVKSIANRINSSSALIIGTQTENRQADKVLLDIITSISPVRMRHKPFFIFGSYGWSGEGAQIIHSILKGYGMKPFAKPFMSIFNLSGERREELKEHTLKFLENICAEN